MKQNLFNSVKMTRPGKNVFDLTHDVKMSCKMGQLFPIMVMDCVPGDKVQLSCDSLLRFAPLISPVMHRMDVTMHYFFVPNRIIWPGWEDFITNTASSGGNLPAFPYIVFDAAVYGERLADYLGLPNPENQETQVSALPFAAYQKIYDEYYRDQNNIDSEWRDLENGNNTDAVYYRLRRRAWEHDYFTAALPFAQKGPGVDIPLGDVELKEDWASLASAPHWKQHTTGITTDGNVISDTTPGPRIHTSANDEAIAYDPDGSLQVQATTINDLRRAFRLQEWLEKNARGGTRYTENIRAQFGVISSDARLQRPEYITGTKSPVVISEVLNTTGESLPQGNMAGHGISVTTGRYGSYFCEEHGYIIGIMSVMPKTAYQQGIPKHFLKINSPLEQYWPPFAHIGEQEVQNQEVFFGDAMLAPDGVFGYVPRYAEYKFIQNRVAGDFKGTLNFWHLGRIFATAPVLNAEFIECDPSDRIFAVTDGTDYLYAHVLNKVRAVRPMPKFGTPTY